MCPCVPGRIRVFSDESTRPQWSSRAGTISFKNRMLNCCMLRPALTLVLVQPQEEVGLLARVEASVSE